MVRANGSYPLCPGFKSLHRHHPLLGKFRKQLRALGLCGQERLLLAISGGGDSVGMLALFLSLRRRPEFVIGVAHVEHGLRNSGGRRDAAAVAALAGECGLPFSQVSLKGRPGRGVSIEEWAREHRYAALEKLRRGGKWDFVATAHSSDDQAETVLMRIARGAGLAGIVGIRPMAGRVVRPVLKFSGVELRSLARECNLEWLSDPTNEDLRFERNRVRLEVMPFLEERLPGFSRHLTALAGEAASLSRPDLQEVAVMETESVYYPLEVLRSLGKERSESAFREGLRVVRGDLRRVGRAHYVAIWSLVESAPGARVALPSGWAGVREKAGIRLKADGGSPK